MAKLPAFLTGDHLALRKNLPLWILRLVQFLVAIIVLAITASNASNFKSLGCSTPSKLGYNIAVAVITFPILIYLILSTGPKHIAAIPWNAFIQLGLTLLLLILWIAAVGASVYNCSDICSACAKIHTAGCSEFIAVGGLYCSCIYDDYYTDTCPVDTINFLEKRAEEMKLTSRALSSSGGRAVRSSKVGAKQAFDVIEMLLLLVSVLYMAFLIFKNRKAASSTTNGEAGAPPMQQDAHGGIGMVPPPQQQTSGPAYGSGPQDQAAMNTNGQANDYYHPNANAGQQYNASSPPQQYNTSPLPQQYNTSPPPQQYNNPPPPQQDSALPPPQQYTSPPVGGYGAPISNTGTGDIPGPYQGSAEQREAQQAAAAGYSYPAPDSSELASPSHNYPAPGADAAGTGVGRGH